MRNQQLGHIIMAAAVLAAPSVALAEESAAPAISTKAGEAIVRAWTADDRHDSDRVTSRLTASLEQTAEQGRASRTAAGPNIGTVGLGGIAGISDLEIGPSFRLWVNDRVGLQAHLGFSGDDIGPENVDFLRFEPTVIIAIGDFGSGAVNVRPYVGGGLRVVRTDIGPFNDSDIKPVGVGGVEFGFRQVPRFKVSAELSVAPNIDVNDFDPPRRGPRLTGARVAALGHYFF